MPAGDAEVGLVEEGGLQMVRVTAVTVFDGDGGELGHACCGGVGCPAEEEALVGDGQSGEEGRGEVMGMEVKVRKRTVENRRE